MSDETYLNLLRAHDDATNAEEPPTFDRTAAESTFVEFARALNSELGVECEFETGISIQDASHHGDIRLPEALTTEPYVVGVRVSNFGRFCCVYDDEAVVKREVLRVIKRVAAEYGYVYIPSNVLTLPYDGANAGVSGFRTWGDRFFDWIQTSIGYGQSSPRDSEQHRFVLLQCSESANLGAYVAALRIKDGNTLSYHRFEFEYLCRVRGTVRVRSTGTETKF